jgi:hypothetical protein
MGTAIADAKPADGSATRGSVPAFVLMAVLVAAGAYLVVRAARLLKKHDSKHESRYCHRREK